MDFPPTRLTAVECYVIVVNEVQFDSESSKFPEHGLGNRSIHYLGPEFVGLSFRKEWVTRHNVIHCMESVRERTFRLCRNFL